MIFTACFVLCCTLPYHIARFSLFVDVHLFAILCEGKVSLRAESVPPSAGLDEADCGVCAFEMGTCGYDARSDGEYKWARGRNGTTTANTGIQHRRCNLHAC